MTRSVPAGSIVVREELVSLFWVRRVLGILCGGGAVLLITGTTAGVTVPAALLVGVGAALFAIGAYLCTRPRLLEFIPPHLARAAIRNVEQAFALADSNGDPALYYSYAEGRSLSRENFEVVGRTPEETRKGTRDLAITLHMALRKHGQDRVEKDPVLGRDVVAPLDPEAVLADFDAALSKWASAHPRRMVHDCTKTLVGWLEYMVGQVEGLEARQSAMMLATVFTQRLERPR